LQSLYFLDNLAMDRPRVLIIGAGITGLLLAQVLQKNGILFCVYERDADAESSGNGWGLAIHWAKKDLMSMLPAELHEGLLNANVDPDAAARGDGGHFPFFELGTGKRLYEIQSEERIRLSRNLWRRLMMKNIPINVRHCVFHNTN
jgi:2-polyprenyl-6-methoxyphenol hydroxylase-like FAD-dependent oxidoreductase